MQKPVEMMGGTADLGAGNDHDEVGAYAVMFSPDQHVLLIEANGGRLYLPGGRLEPFETAELALLREIREECGCGAHILSRLGSAFQPVNGGKKVLKAHYFIADIHPSKCKGEHPTFWVPADEGIRRVHRASDSWAIEKALDYFPTSDAKFAAMAATA